MLPAGKTKILTGERTTPFRGRVHATPQSPKQTDQHGERFRQLTGGADELFTALWDVTVELSGYAPDDGERMTSLLAGYADELGQLSGKRPCAEVSEANGGALSVVPDGSELHDAADRRLAQLEADNAELRRRLAEAQEVAAAFQDEARTLRANVSNLLTVAPGGVS